ncbi:Lsr2 family protein [Streptomyces sp. NPDC048636]|uniref:histone-like nucleoid-structuring protein Lsr2 n=1 Tax=Streptomyces sp. NPDC048636 TaxID=3155762 RepID=UPI00342E8443
MADRTILVDDLDPMTTQGVERIAFSYRGTEYEIDLGPVHQAELEAALQKFLAGARPRKPGRRAPRSYTRIDPAQTQRMRDWAGKQGLSVPTRGPLPKRIREAYEAAQPDPSHNPTAAQHTPTSTRKNTHANASA